MFYIIHMIHTYSPAPLLQQQGQSHREEIPVFTHVNRLDQLLTHAPGGINIIAEKPTTELPDAMTIFKLLFAATQKKYHHVIIFALLINELGIISTLL